MLKYLTWVKVANSNKLGTLLTILWNATMSSKNLQIKALDVNVIEICLYVFVAMNKEAGMFVSGHHF